MPPRVTARCDRSRCIAALDRPADTKERRLRRELHCLAESPLFAGGGPPETSSESVRNAAAMKVELEAIGSFQWPFPLQSAPRRFSGHWATSTCVGLVR